MLFPQLVLLSFLFLNLSCPAVSLVVWRFWCPVLSNRFAFYSFVCNLIKSKFDSRKNNRTLNSFTSTYFLLLFYWDKYYTTRCLMKTFTCTTVTEIQRKSSISFFHSTVVKMETSDNRDTHYWQVSHPCNYSSHTYTVKKGMFVWAFTSAHVSTRSISKFTTNRF